MRVLFIGDAELEAIRTDWIAGHSINKICQKFSHGTEQIRDMAERHGWPERQARDALPAGHPATWGAITSGSVIDGCAFPR